MKLSTLTIFMILLTFTIVLFQDTASINPDSGEIEFDAGADDSDSGITTKLWDFVKNPHQWSAGSIIFYLAITLIAALAGGTLYASISNSYAPDTYIFGVFYSGLLFLGAYPCWLLYNFIQTELTPYVCGGATSPCFLPVFLATLFSFGLGITWVFTVIKSWRTAAD